MLEARITSWTEREPDVFIARRSEDHERRRRERRQGGRCRRSDAAWPETSMGSSHG